MLSFKQVAALDNVRITIDTSIEKAMLVHVNDLILKFRECKDGLYYLNMKDFNVDNHKTKSTVNHYPHTSNNFCLVHTVEHNKSLFSKKQIKMAELAKKLQQNMGFPGNDVFKKILRNNLVINFPVTVDDFNRSLQIFGTSESILKGRMTAPTQVSHRIATSSVPDELKNTHKNVQLFTDFFFVNGLCFLVVISDIITYLSITHMENKKSPTIIKHLNDIITKYRSRNFIITDVFADGEFDVDDIATSILPSSLHICSADEHVPKIERTIRTIKERARTICHTLPYDSFPKMLTISLLKTVTTWLNAFPSSTAINEKYSPANIIDGRPNPDYNRKMIPFGAYAMVYFGTNNTMAQRAVPAIALYEGTLDGNYFFTLDTGKKIHSKKWDQLPISDEILDYVDAFASKQKQPFLPRRIPIFEWSPGLIIDLAEHDDFMVDDNLILDAPPPIDIDSTNIVSDDDESIDGNNGDGDDIFTDEDVVHVPMEHDDVLAPDDDDSSDHHTTDSITSQPSNPRTICHTLPYDSFPKMLTISLLKTVPTWLNAFPSSTSISEKCSPANIIDGRPNPDYNRKRIPFGAYAMVYFSTNNTMAQAPKGILFLL